MSMSSCSICLPTPEDLINFKRDLDEVQFLSSAYLDEKIEVLLKNNQLSIDAINQIINSYISSGYLDSDNCRDISLTAVLPSINLVKGKNVLDKRSIARQMIRREFYLNLLNGNIGNIPTQLICNSP